MYRRNVWQIAKKACLLFNWNSSARTYQPITQRRQALKRNFRTKIIWMFMLKRSRLPLPMKAAREKSGIMERLKIFLKP
jgi:hypothetical protein